MSANSIFVFSNSLFLTYMIMAFVGLQGITLTIIVIKHAQKGEAALLVSIRNFAISTFMLGTYYFYTYYRELVLGDYAANEIMRAVDSSIFFVVGWAWIKVLVSITNPTGGKVEKWKKWIDTIFISLIFVSACTYIFLLDEYYSTDSLFGEIFAIIVEVLLGAVVILLNIRIFKNRHVKMTDKITKIVVVLISVLVNFNNLWNNAVAIGVFTHAIESDFFTSKLYGITSIGILIINSALVFYVYKKDFSPQYFTNVNTIGKGPTTEEYINLDNVAEKYKLTLRERDVMILAYEGKTNPEIATILYISKNTVKRHLHNTFEKLKVASRIEMIHLLRKHK